MYVLSFSKLSIRITLLILACLTIARFSDPVHIDAQINSSDTSFFVSPIRSGYTDAERTTDFMANFNCIHPGIDIWKAEGQRTIQSIADGVVVQAESGTTGFGNHVLIRHTLAEGTYIYSHYGHLASIQPSILSTPNYPIRRGDEIGTMGHTGNVQPSPGGDGTHLHFELRAQNFDFTSWINCNDSIETLNGGEIPRYLDPEQFINAYNTTDRVRFFEHSYFRGENNARGRFWDFSFNSNTFQNFLDDQNDLASSVVVPRGWMVEVYRDKDAKGPKQLINYNDVNFNRHNLIGLPAIDTFTDENLTPLNDNISSLRTYKNDPTVQVGSISYSVPPVVQAHDWNIKYFNYDPNNPNNKWECTPDRYTGFNGTYPFMDWGEDGPSTDPIQGNDCQRDFIAEISGSKNFSAGTYTAYLYADDQAWMEIVGASPQNKVVDRWNNTTSPIETFTINSSGNHDVRVYFKDNAGTAWVQAWWEGPGTPAPSNALYPSMVREVRDVNQWFGEYYGVRHWPADSIVSRNEGNAVPFTRDWGAGSPGYGLPKDKFSTKFEKLHLFACGWYDFTLNADDYGEMVIDPHFPLVQMQTQLANNPVTQTNVYIPEGNHLVRVKQREEGGDARVSADWTLRTACPIPTPTATPTPIPSCTVAPSGSFCADYYNSVNLTGPVVFHTNESTINHNWGNGGPGNGVNIDDFSTRWLGKFNFNAGNYEFSLTADDGVRLWIDNNLVIDKWIDQPATNYKATKTLSAGEHEIKVEYYEHGGGAVAELAWAAQTGCTSIPTGSFCTEYYNNLNLTSPAVFVQNEAQINHNWGGGGPGNGVNNDNFSARWRGNFNLIGNYTFTVVADDGVRFWVDNNLLIDKWIDQPATQYSSSVNLSNGLHEIKMEYYEKAGGAVAEASWSQNVATPTPTPSSQEVELLTAPWNLTRTSSGAEERYQSIAANALAGKTTLKITYNLHGLNALGGDASAIIFDQNGWKYISLSNYGQNGLNGTQTVQIPLSNFTGLNTSTSVGTLHTRFWNSAGFTVDITSIKVY